jgi:hypothetical protein
MWPCKQEKNTSVQNSARSFSTTKVKNMATASNSIFSNLKQSNARASKMETRSMSMRTELWKEISEDQLWDRKKANGFTTMPRTMAHLINIIDSLTKGTPAGMVYLTIWCRLFSVGILELASESEMAFEAGFSGERAVDTWRKRMRPLKEYGFIDYKPGASHEFQWVLVYNPHHVVQKLGKKIQDRYRTAWLGRAMEVGAKDATTLPERKSLSQSDKTVDREKVAKSSSDKEKPQTIKVTKRRVLLAK